MPDAPIFEEIRAQLTKICEEGDLERPDLIVDTGDGEFAAIWIDSKLVVEIGEEQESERVSPVHDPEFFEAVHSILELCDGNDFPRPDAAVYDAERRRIEFAWTDGSGSAAGLAELASSVRGTGKRARVAGTPSARPLL